MYSLKEEIFMYPASQAKESLKGEEWEAGKVIPVSEGPYRFRVVVHCSPQGRQKADFQNGENPYFSYVQLLSGDGQWIMRGAGMVPVLPDGRFIMVVEQRAPQGLYDNPMMARIGGREVDLLQHGAFSSLEFPGGAVDPGEGLKAGFLRELAEETGVGEQHATYYARRPPFYPHGSDLALQQHAGVVFLSGVSFPDRVDTDGGLAVYALTRAEVVYNIRHGVIRSQQAALTQWAFYLEVEEARAQQAVLQEMIDDGYLSVEQVKISIPK